MTNDASSLSAPVSQVLRAGVLIAAAVLVLGVTLLVAESGTQDTSSYLMYNPNLVPHGTFDPSLAGLASGIATVNPFSIVALGALILLATPVARVALSLVLFASERDKLYVYITGTVLLLLLFSMLVTPYIPHFNG